MSIPCPTWRTMERAIASFQAFCPKNYKIRVVRGFVRAGGFCSWEAEYQCQNVGIVECFAPRACFVNMIKKDKPDNLRLRTVEYAGNLTWKCHYELTFCNHVCSCTIFCDCDLVEDDGFEDDTDEVVVETNGVRAFMIRPMINQR